MKNQTGLYPSYGNTAKAEQAILATITDKRLLTENPNNINPNTWYWDADIVSAQDYYAFGMLMPDRLYQADDDGYRYGFNNMERDDEWNGTGNNYDFGARIYNARIGQVVGRRYGI